MPAGNSSNGSANAVRAGRAYVELFTKDNVSKSLDKVQARLFSFGGFVNKIGNGALKAGSVLLAPVAALFAGTLARAKDGVFGGQAQGQAQRFTNAWTRAILALQSGLLPVLEILVPIMETFATLAAQNRSAPIVIGAVGAALLVLGIAAKGLAAASVLAGVAIGAVKLAILAATTPLWLLVGGLVALFASRADWQGLFGKLGETGKSAIGGIVNALRSGQLELAADIAVAGLKLIWHDLVEFMKDGIRDLIGTLGGVAKMIVIIKAAQVGAGVGGVFGPIGAIIGGGLGAGAGAIAVNEIDKAIKALIQPSDPAERAKLAKELADLLAKVKPPDLKPAVMAAEAAKGLFSAPNFRQALGFGDNVKDTTLAVARDGVRILGEIAENTRDMGASFA